MSDFLAAILRRKASENGRRRRFASTYLALQQATITSPAPFRRQQGWDVEALRRKSADLPHVIAELKFASPSRGSIRQRRAGDAQRIASDYFDAGASAVSVLADRVGFGGSALDVRRVSSTVDLPVLFKEFVLDQIQVDLAALVGASMVLLLVCALDDADLQHLVRYVRSRGMEPVVEAASETELHRALSTPARLIGVNARDLRNFRIDSSAAERCIAAIPADRIAIWMSGVQCAEDLRRVADGRADAVLIGESLMAANHPGERLRELLVTSRSGAGTGVNGR